MKTQILVVMLGIMLVIAQSEADAAVPCVDPNGCPDLIVYEGDLHEGSVVTRTFQEGDCAVLEGATVAGTRKLLQFTSTTINIGPGELVVGRAEEHPEWFTFDPCHFHYHFFDYADYRLWTVDGYNRWKALKAANPAALSRDLLASNPELNREFVAGAKQGFCVIDLKKFPKYKPVNAFPKYEYCQWEQGLSVGWADSYVYLLDGQWIDVTDVLPGTYMLEDEVNAERLFNETNYRNNSAAVQVKIR